MTSNVPPAIRHQHQAERLELLSRMEGLTTELASIAERLFRIEGATRLRPTWQLCAKLARNIRSQARHQRDEQRRRAKRNPDPDKPR